MALLSRKVDYALLILSYLHHQPEGASARHVAERFRLKPAFAANVLKLLGRKGLVRSQRGTRGGYVLARPAEAIALCELLDLLEEPFHLADCTQPGFESEGGCGLQTVCPLRNAIAEVDRRIRDVLARVTLADLVRQAPSAEQCSLFALPLVTHQFEGAMVTPIYMDNNATTRVDPRVVEAMLPWFGEQYGNAASKHHAFGRAAAEAVEQARSRVAERIGGQPREVIFTSGATESNNLAIKGVAAAYRGRGTHLVTVQTEHHAVLDPIRRLSRDGFEATVLPVDSTGRVFPEQIEAALTDKTVLVSVMAANNEIGTLQPIEAIGAICKRRGVLFHCDAVQALANLELDVERMGIDLLSLSAHKIYGPKGVGALWVRRNRPTVRLEPMFEGGGQERGMRSGTLNVPGIVGFGKACELTGIGREEEAERLRGLRDRLREGIEGGLEGVTLNGHPTERLPGNLNLSFDWVRGEALLMGLSGVAVSSGSACTAANPEPSYVLRAIGVDEVRAYASLRFGAGRFTTADEVERVIAEVVRVVSRLREISPEYEMHRFAERVGVGASTNKANR